MHVDFRFRLLISTITIQYGFITESIRERNHVAGEYIMY